MGTDIHDYAEVRRGGRWVKVGAAFLSPHHDSGKPSVQLCWVNEQWVVDFHPRSGEPCSRDCRASNPRLVEHPLCTRDYNAFAILAGVRNHDAGSEGAFLPIARPRGLPEDVTAEVAEISKLFGLDGHSHSWLTLGEVIAYDWSRPTMWHGFVDARQYLAFKEHGRPAAGYSSAVRRGERVSSNHAMERAIAAGRDRRGWVTEVGWGEPCAASAADFLGRTVPALLGLIVPPELMEEASAFLAAAQSGDTTAGAVLDDWLMDRGLPPTSDVRIVFWFDN